ncbi:prepilin-type N-terminal cleavage/methylation domain-containing protein [Eubacterium sp. CAG:841]|nr:prepilin-type N-terminal cleavage/methylation domain-containing protein [Eubacterium sp. CAG:841]
MKKQNKKGFTLVELVIVIAVIAILAGVMIGTFSSVVKNANKSSDLQEVKTYIDNLYYDYIADAKGEVPNCFVWSEESDSYTVVGFGVMPEGFTVPETALEADKTAGKAYYAVGANDVLAAPVATEPTYTKEEGATEEAKHTYYVVNYKDYTAKSGETAATWTVVSVEKVVVTVPVDGTNTKASTHYAPSVEVVGRKKTTLTLSFDEKGNYTVANKAD